MSSLSFLYVYLIGVSLILLLTAVSEAQLYDDYPTTPDYDSDYNGTFEYSFFSNTSTDDLDKFLKGDEEVISTEEPEDVEGEEVTVTTATTRGATERVDVYNAASLPVHLDFRTLVWTLMILISLNVQQLQHTL